MPGFRTMRPLMAGMLLLMPTLSQAHELEVDSLRIAHPFSTPMPAAAPHGAAYVDIMAGEDDAVLTGASSPVSKAVEVHDMQRDGDRMKMRKLEELRIDAGDTVSMRPGGGPHLMLIGLEESLEEGERFPLTLQFADREPIDITVPVQTSATGDETTDANHGH
ncbi:copper chaperone PCu(A)C [Aidingimonas lacisalsi]|uniref:copper chaperone PCu(A)C n=1 Tax=Aidingimonas lacisalsi TaxID=2604086 RepID=UPI001F25299B|nr:copper chaperone PCu(A)C [Aidingimonas lacisalsi]